MKHPGLRTTIMLALLASLLIGCQTTTGRTAGTSVDDDVITSNVKSRLASEGMGTLESVDVETDRGVVTLTGVVDTFEQKHEAGQIARGIDGVKRVENNLLLQRSSRLQSDE